MKALKFQTKLWIPLVTSLFCMLALAFFDARELRAVRIAERSNALRDVTQMAVSTMREYAAFSDAGKMSQADAQREAIARINKQRYGTDGYLSVVDFNNRMVMSPTRPELNGSNVADVRDENGAYPFREITALITGPGRGYVSYVWPRPGASKAEPKLSYAESFQPWRVAVVTGVYMDDIEAAFMASVYRSLGVFGAVAVLLSAVVILINRSLRTALGGQLEAAIAVIRRIADGDLRGTIAVAPGDTCSLLFHMRQMRDTLADTITGIRHSSSTIASASAEIAAGNLDLSSRTERQAGALEETAASMEELSSIVKQNAEHVQRANALAQQASASASEGGRAVAEVVATMGVIGDSARRIEEITGVIDGIAFQTNILALNAAVEAARAGEQGRGFAVVAAEVRNLAHRSACAAKEIKAVIEQSVRNVAEGRTQVHAAGEKMDRIVGSVASVTSIMHEITTAGREQSNGIAEISEAIMQMDQTTQQNAALVEEAAAAAASMSEQATVLNDAVHIFTLADLSPQMPEDKQIARQPISLGTNKRPSHAQWSSNAGVAKLIPA